MTVRTLQAGFIALFLAVLVYLDYQLLVVLFNPLAWAAVLATVFFPFHRRINRWFRSRNGAAGLSVLLLVVLIVTPAVLAGTICVREGIRLFENIHRGDVVRIAQQGLDWLSARLDIPNIELEDQARELAQQAAGAMAKGSASLAGNLVKFIFNLLITVIVTFFLLRDGPALIGFLRDTSPVDRDLTESIIRGVENSVTASFQGNVLTALAQGSLAGVIFWILGINAAVFWGVVSGVVAFLPVIAPALVWGGVSIYLFTQGQILKGILMVLLGTFVISSVDNLIRPAFIASRSRMPTLLALISVFGGIGVFGFLGIVLGPLLAALTIGLLESYRNSVLQAQTEEPGRVESG